MLKSRCVRAPGLTSYSGLCAAMAGSILSERRFGEADVLRSTVLPDNETAKCRGSSLIAWRQSSRNPARPDNILGPRTIFVLQCRSMLGSAHRKELQTRPLPNLCRGVLARAGALLFRALCSSRRCVSDIVGILVGGPGSRQLSHRPRLSARFQRLERHQ